MANEFQEDQFTHIITINAGISSGAVHLDGSTWLQNFGLIAGDSNMLLASYWYRSTYDIGAGGAPVWVGNPNANMLQNFTTGTFLGSLDTLNSLAFGSTITPANDVYHNILIAADTVSLIGKIFIDDIDVSDLPTIVGASFTMQASGFSFAIGSDTFDNNVIMDFADFWWGLGQFMDLTVEANRRKFITAAGKPANLGSDGSTPTGIAPTIYLHKAPGDDPVTFANDKSGNGNNFTIFGTLTNATSAP